MVIHLWFHHNSHSRLSGAHHYHNFSSPVKTKQIQNTLWCAMHFVQRGDEKFQTPAEVHYSSVTDDPGSKPDQKYARRRDRQNYMGKIK